MSTSSKTEQIAGNVHNESESSRMVAVRRFVLLAGPVGAAIAMWFHPHAGDDVYGSLSPVAETFVATHLLLFTSLAVIAVGLYLLSARYRGRLATVSRAGTGVFAFFYLGFVAIVGVAKGLLIREGQTLPADQQAGVAHVVQYIHTDQLLFMAGVIGALGYLVAVSALAAVFYRNDAPRIPIVLLVVSVIAIGAHDGLIAMAGIGSFVVAVGWFEFGWTQSEESTPAP